MWRAAVILGLSIGLSGCGGIMYVHSGPGEDRRSELEKAVMAADMAKVRSLLAAGANPNARDGAFGSPLNAAAMKGGNADVIQALLAAGANPNGRGEDAQGSCWASPLFHAVHTNDVANTRALLDGGATMDTAGCSKLVAGWLTPSMLDLLVARGFKLNAVDEHGRNQMHFSLAAPVMPFPESIEYLLRSGVPFNARDRQGRTPLALWREPHGHEADSFAVRLLDGVSGEQDTAGREHEREVRRRITDLLEHAGASL